MWWTRCKTISQKYLGWTSFQWARLPAWSANSMLQIPHVFNANGTNLFLPRFDVPFFSGFLSPLVDWNSKKIYIEWFPFQYQSKKGSILKNQFLFLKLPYLWALGNHLILLTLAFGKRTYRSYQIGGMIFNQNDRKYSSIPGWARLPS